MNEYASCTLCPRRCGVDRRVHRGVCGESDRMRIARAALHKWEEPAICTGNGSGAIFFSGCPLRCCYCQNHEISQEGLGFEITHAELADKMLSLQKQGACNISLITAAQFVPSVIKALDTVKDRLTIPIVYNSSGYESIETLKMLDGYIDIYLPDIKYFSSLLSQRYSSAPDYFETASLAVDEMIRQVGKPIFDGETLVKGVIVRHLALPSHKDDSIAIMKYIGKKYASNSLILSVMRQYVPMFGSRDFPEINRRLTTYEYDRILDEADKYGFYRYIQDKSSSDECFTPKFYGDKDSINI